MPDHSSRGQVAVDAGAALKGRFSGGDGPLLHRCEQGVGGLAASAHPVPDNAFIVLIGYMCGSRRKSSLDDSAGKWAYSRLVPRPGLLCPALAGVGFLWTSFCFVFFL